MTLYVSHNPALVLSLALAAGIIFQILARHLRVPGIVVLLARAVSTPAVSVWSTHEHLFGVPAKHESIEHV